MNDKLNIKIGKEYDAYNDGKKSPSRLARVVITDEAKLQELGRHFISVWRNALKEDFKMAYDGHVHFFYGKNQVTCRMWDWNCDHFYFGEIPGDEESKKDPMLIARTAWGGWYCVNWNYEIDFNGRVRKNNIKNWKLCAKEMGQTMKWNAKEGMYEYFDLKTGKKLN